MPQDSGLHPLYPPPGDGMRWLTAWGPWLLLPGHSPQEEDRAVTRDPGVSLLFYAADIKSTSAYSQVFPEDSCLSLVAPLPKCSDT